MSGDTHLLNLIKTQTYAWIQPDICAYIYFFLNLQLLTTNIIKMYETRPQHPYMVQKMAVCQHSQRIPLYYCPRYTALLFLLYVQWTESLL